MNKGIDYGMGMSNIDKSNGIRYGVISQNAICQAWGDNCEGEYGKPSDREVWECEECGKPLDIDSKVKWGDNITCTNPKCEHDNEIEMPEMMEPSGYSYQGDGYVMTNCLDSDVMVIKSDYYTYGPFCSPCVPGAVSLPDTPPDPQESLLHKPYPYDATNGVKAYCVGHDWFESNIATYPVYRVKDDKQIVAKLETICCTYCEGKGRRSTITLAGMHDIKTSEMENRIAKGEIRVDKLDIVNHTYECHVCQGSGKVEQVVETIVD